jgi:iron complex outermembrane recepter protein
MRSRTVNCAIAVTAALYGQVSLAQTAATANEDSDRLGEIIVTAQKRSENLQSVPLTVTVLSASELAQSGITDLDNLSTRVAGFIGPGDYGEQPMHLRGVGSLVAAPGNEGSVSLYIDGVYMGNVIPAYLELNNVEQIEVLKGPQGTLFGRNATAGLIQITTPTPGQNFVANGQVSYANYQTGSGSAYVAGPLNDNIAADVAVQTNHQVQGWGRNLYDGADIKKDDLDLSLRSKWVFSFDEATRLILIGDYESSKTFGIEAFRAIPGTYSIFGTPNIATGWDVDDDTIPTMRTEGHGVSARLEHDFGFARFSSITAYNVTQEADLGIDYTVTPLPALTAYQWPHHHQFSEELQLASRSEAAFVWTIGLYYSIPRTRPSASVTTAFRSRALRPARCPSARPAPMRR